MMTKNRTFTTATGRTATVWDERAVARQGFWTGVAGTVRTFVTVEGSEAEVEVEAGCSFMAESAVRSAGF